MIRLERFGLLVGALALITLRLDAAEHTKDSLQTVRDNVSSKKAVLLDVRELNEWEAGRLKVAQLLPLSKIKTGADPKSVDESITPKTIIYTHCKSGRRCLEAADLLKQKGYDVRPLKDGYEQLLKAGFEKAAP